MFHLSLQVLDLKYCFSSRGYPVLKIQYYPVPISHLWYLIVYEQYQSSTARYRVPITQCRLIKYLVIQCWISNSGFWYVGKYKASNIRKQKGWEGEPQCSNFVQLAKNANMVDTFTLLLLRNRHSAVFHSIAIFPDWRKVSIRQTHTFSLFTMISPFESFSQYSGFVQKLPFDCFSQYGSFPQSAMNTNIVDTCTLTMFS